LLVKDGNILHEALLRARISKDEFESYLRLSGIDDISNTKTSYLEIIGQVLSKKAVKRLKNYYYYYRMLSMYYCRMDAILKSIIKRQIPFLIGGTITGTIMAYYYGFLFTIIVNSIMWYVISSLVSKYYYKVKGVNDQKYLIQYGLSKIKSRNKGSNISLQ
jgi:hypothetical protein